MEMITSATIFKSFDGKIFTSEKDCKEYEKHRKEFLNNLKFFEIRYSPDLTETGNFTRCLFVAVYSESGFNKEIVINYCIKNFGYLGEGVQGHRFQPYFDVYPINFEKFTKGIIEDWRGNKRHIKKIYLSPTELDDFKDIERFDYMKEWGFKL